jgi:cytochrome c peroxidase
MVSTLPAAELTLEITPRWQGRPLAVPSGQLTNSRGQSLRITRLSALISNVNLLRPDGGVVRLGQYGLVDAETGRLTTTLKGVPTGDYGGLEFLVGVPPQINHSDPGSWPAGHPLNPLVDELHWNWKGGYIFFALEGRWTDTLGPSPVERGFVYHVANDEHVTRVRFLSHFHVGDETTVTLALEVSGILAKQALVFGDGSESTHSERGDDLAAHMATALQHGFFWLGVAASSRMPVSALVGPARVPTRGTPRAFIVPAGFPQPDLPADNPLTVEGIALGKALFHDVRLSRNHSLSCASCHAPSRAFSDCVPLSIGADGRPGRRNALPLFNLAWSRKYAWDGSKEHVRDQVEAAITSPLEMHGDPDRVVADLRLDAAMSAEFRIVFGPSGLTADNVGLALEQYVLTLVSSDSKFDRAIRGQGELAPEEKRGFELFVTEYDPARGKRGADCFHCHGGALFTDYAFKNNGLAILGDDLGLGSTTGRAADAGKFKTPSLRNVALTGPYMHDGRLATLEEVVDHYDHSVVRSATLDPNLAKHPVDGLGLSAADRAALVAFLRSLTDPAFEKDVRPD